MREILFRGLTINGDWVYGLLSHANPKLGVPKGDDWYISNSNGRPLAYQVRPETIGQWTGQMDKNGTKVFEGDFDRKFGESIQWYNDKGCYALFSNGMVQSYPIDWSRIEVGGNIYEP